MRRAAFTLVEIMTALAIAGIIMTAGIAPLLYTVRIISLTRDAYTARNSEKFAINRIFSDAREILRLNMNVCLRIVPSGELGTDSDFLVVWTMTPSYAMRPMGSVVWGIPGMTLGNDALEGGLYRLVVSGDIPPASVKPGELDFKEGTLVLRGARTIKFSALDGSEWKDEYSGAGPPALRAAIDSGYGENVYEETLPVF
ncbi:MAG: type II secretion system GspH family protein [Synergistaceae bacterium]|jgi:prepilin-type N-terminal cleavage/methylation domain-containing protein|nr:type II secretion system GspH family protein [Synergistaceae bacterium]